MGTCTLPENDDARADDILVTKGRCAELLDGNVKALTIREVLHIKKAAAGVALGTNIQLRFLESG